MCECANMAGYGPQSWGKHHHVNCPKYHSEKFPYLLYYEDAVDAWVFAPSEVEQIISVSDQLEEGEVVEISFKRAEFTDAEVTEVPEG